MGFWSKLFGQGSAEEIEPRSYRERDNSGTRHDTYSLASSYWLSRMANPKKDPFVLYSFDSEEAAREALLELPCIHVAEDSGKLICTEVLVFGHYETKEGKHEASVCGDDLTHELWEQAKASFNKHGGKPRGEGDLEPVKRAAPAGKAKAPTKAEEVVFVREDRRVQMGHTMIYRIHKAPDAVTAKAFLKKNPVIKQLYYIIIETPDGNYCGDIQGIYKE